MELIIPKTSSTTSLATTSSRLLSTTAASSLVSTDTRTSAIVASTPSALASSTTGLVSSLSSASASVSSDSTALNATKVVTSAALNVSSTMAVSSAVVSSSSIAAQTSSAAPQQSQQTLATTIDAAGQTVIVTQFYTASAASTVVTSSASVVAAATSSSSSSSSSSSDGASISTAAIIGISVAVGAVLLSLVGCAIWRMKRRSGDEDEAIRWPELNRHGDSSAHHALPARQTGQHGFATNPLERSVSNSSSSFAPTTSAAPHSAGPVPMALNGSSFGAASSLEYDEKAEDQPSGGAGMGIATSGYDAYPVSPTYSGYGYEAGPGGVGPVTGHSGHSARGHSMYGELEEDYTSFPPPMSAAPSNTGLAAASYESGSDEEHGRGTSRRLMAVANPDQVTYGIS